MYCIVSKSFHVKQHGSPQIGIRYMATKVKSSHEEEAILGLNVSFTICKYHNIPYCAFPKKLRGPKISQQSC